MSENPFEDVTEIDVTDLENEERRRLQSSESESTLVFTEDETVAYTPDSEENSEGFEVEIEELPIAEEELIEV